MENLIGTGRTAEIYGLDDRRVLKLFYPWFPSDLVRAEVTVTRSLEHLELPFAQLLETVQVDGRAGIVYERVYGKSLLEQFVTGVKSADRVGTHLAELHHAVHSCGGEQLPSLRSDLSQKINRSQSLSERKRHQIIDLLEELPAGNCLCHMDFHPGQILGSGEQLRIIDWGAACKGNLLADVALTLLLLRIAEIPAHDGCSNQKLALLRRQMSTAYLERYLQLQDKATLEEIDSWLLVMAAARLYENIEGEQTALNQILNEELESAAR